MNEASPQRMANSISLLLREVLGDERFPVKIKEVAREYTAHRFPDDPITMIRGDILPSFEGSLVPAPQGKKGWGIIYNSDITSKGRINFTLAHEFGHYLLHRLRYPRGFQCSQDDVTRWESEYGRIEHQANLFAATLLMPFDDFRRQIDARNRPNLNDLSICADRYEVSLLAATLRWLQFTQRRSVLVISRDGFILWARSSDPALKSGLYYKTRGRPPIEVPTSSLAARRSLILGHTNGAVHDRGVWLNEPCVEQVLFAEQYDFTISLLHFDDVSVNLPIDDEGEDDLYDLMTKSGIGRS